MMFRLLCAVVLTISFSTASLGQPSLVGMYKMVSQVVDVEGAVTENIGKAPRGYLVFTPTRATAFYTAESRITAVKGLDNLNQLVPAVESLGRRNIRYGVIDAHYETVGVTLLWALERGLGETFTPAVRDLQVCKPGSPSSHGPTACWGVI